MSGTAEAATDQFTLWRAGLPPWLQRNQLTLRPTPSTTAPASRGRTACWWSTTGAVVLSCTEGDLALDRGAVFFLTGLHAPTLRNPHPTPATVATASRKAGFPAHRAAP